MENCVAESLGNRLPHAFDAGILIHTDAHLPGTPPSLDSVEQDDSGSSVRTTTVSSEESNDSDNESNRCAGLGAIIQVLSESVLRMEAAEMEMLKAREAWRVEAERRSAESEHEMTQMLIDTQFQIASLVSQAKKKRKRVHSEEGEDDGGDSNRTERQRLLMLGLLQSNLSFL